MLRLTLVATALLSGVWALAQDTVAIRFAETIQPQDLYGHLSVIASDEFEGRETGRSGQKKTAAYIQQHFKNWKLEPVGDDGYLQSFPVRVTHPGGVEIELSGAALQLNEDFYNYKNGSNGTYAADEVVYAGFGINHPSYNDYKKLNVKDRIIMVSAGEPKDKGNFWLDGDRPTSWTYDWRKKAVEAESQGAKAMLVIDPDFKMTLGRMKGFMERQKFELVGEGEESTAGIPVIYISRKMADRLLILGGQKKSSSWLEKHIGKKKKPKTVTAQTPINIVINRKIENLKSENVAGIIKGTKFPNEVVVVTAHYDHLGIRGDDIYNGADDDGSGTVSLMEMAQAYSLAKAAGYGPKRSIMFLAVSGEEKGLYGSEYFADNPTIPLKDIVANLNIDMIGRVDIEHEEDSLYTYIIGSDKLSTELHQINEKANTTYSNLDLDYRYNDENDPNRFYYRSDHYNFAKNGIPVIFYFTGVHEDYHKPTDTVDKIMFGKLSQIARLVFHTSWELTNRAERIIVDKEFEE